MYRILVIGGCAVLLAACGTTQQAQVSQADLKCAFLGSACQQLTPGGEGQAALRYVNPAAGWSRYTKIMIQPVTFWGDEKSKVSAEDQQRLVDFLHNALQQELSTRFQIADQNGPDVMKLQVALTDVAAATPGLRTMTMVVPQARLLSTLKRGATGSYPFVGGAQAEFKLTDSTTDTLLAAGVDRRIGGGSVETAAQWQWGDAENAMTYWAKTAAERLSSWTKGTAKASS
jgi:Protein of unknown function (DUF3313)